MNEPSHEVSVCVAVATVVHTRPHLMKTSVVKLANGEKWLNSFSNYFKLTRPSAIYKYHISFDSEVLLAEFRRSLVRQHIEKIGGYLFDGTQLITINPLPNIQCWKSQSYDGNVYQLTIKRTNVLEMGTTEAYCSSWPENVECLWAALLWVYQPPVSSFNGNYLSSINSDTILSWINEYSTFNVVILLASIYWEQKKCDAVDVFILLHTFILMT